MTLNTILSVVPQDTLSGPHHETCAKSQINKSQEKSAACPKRMDGLRSAWDILSWQLWWGSCDGSQTSKQLKLYVSSANPNTKSLCLSISSSISWGKVTSRFKSRAKFHGQHQPSHFLVSHLKNKPTYPLFAFRTLRYLIKCFHRTFFWFGL